MPDLIYVRIVSEQCRDDNHLDCTGKFQDGKTVEGKPIWRKCDCDCEVHFNWRTKRARLESV